MSYNLLDRPWIPVTTGIPTHPIEEVSLVDVVLRAHELIDLDAPSPLTTSAVTRLILAFLHRALRGPRTQADHADVAAAGQFPQDAILAYCATWYDRFDLLSTRHPFYQSLALVNMPKAQKAATQLTFSRASERNKPLFFDMSQPDSHLSFAEAALGVVTTQAYSAGGLMSFDDPAQRSAKAAPLVGVGIWRARGRTLFDTLMANLLPYADQPNDLPAWERETGVLVPTERLPVGRCDWYTWQSRRLLLIPNGDGVARVVMMKGEQIIDQGNPWQDDPQVARSSDGVLLYPRGQSAAVCLGEAISSLPLVHVAPTTRDLALVLTWLVTNQAKYVSWHATRVVIPATLLARRAAWVTIFHQVATFAQTLETLLRACPLETPAGKQESPMHALVRLAPQRENEYDAAPLRYWAELDLAFRAWLASIALGVLTTETALDAWYDDARQVAQRAYEGSANHIPDAQRREEEITQLLDHFTDNLELLTSERRNPLHVS